MMTEMQIIAALKKLLKQQGNTYRDVASWLDLSEGSVKRLFAKGEMRLDRLVAILSHLGRDMNDLVSIANADSKHISQVTVEQERELVSDIPTLLVAVATISHLSFDDMVAYYGFPATIVEQSLLKLDKMGFIALQPNNHYLLNVSANFRWRTNGPIQRFFMENLSANYMSKPLAKDDKLVMMGAMLSEASSRQLDVLIDEFLERLQSLNIVDRPLPLAEKSDTFIVLAKRRHWYDGDGVL